MTNGNSAQINLHFRNNTNKVSGSVSDKDNIKSKQQFNGRKLILNSSNQKLIKKHNNSNVSLSFFINLFKVTKSIFFDKTFLGIILLRGIFVGISADSRDLTNKFGLSCKSSSFVRKSIHALLDAFVFGLFVLFSKFIFTLLMQRSKWFGDFMLLNTLSGLSLSLLARFVAVALLNTFFLSLLIEYTNFYPNINMFYVLVINFAGIFFGLLESREVLIATKMPAIRMIRLKSIAFYNSLIFHIMSLVYTVYAILVLFYSSIAGYHYAQYFLLLGSFMGFAHIITVLIVVPSYLQIRSLIIEAIIVNRSLLSGSSFAVLSCISSFSGEIATACVVLVTVNVFSIKENIAIVQNLSLLVLITRMLIGYFTKLGDINTDRAEKVLGADSQITKQLDFFDSMGDVVGDTLGYHMTVAQLAFAKLSSNANDIGLSCIIISKSYSVIFNLLLSQNVYFKIFFSFALYILVRSITIILSSSAVSLLFELSIFKSLPFFVKRVTFSVIDGVLLEIINVLLFDTMSGVVLYSILRSTMFSTLLMISLLMPYFISKNKNIVENRQGMLLNNVFSATMSLLFGLVLPILLSGYITPSVINSDVVELGATYSKQIHSLSSVSLINDALIFTLMDSVINDVPESNQDELEQFDVLGNAIAGSTKFKLALLVIKSPILNVFKVEISGKFIFLLFLFISSLYLALGSVKFDAQTNQVYFASHYFYAGLCLIAIPTTIAGFMAINNVQNNVNAISKIMTYLDSSIEKIFMWCINNNLVSLLFTLGASFDNWKKGTKLIAKSRPTTFNKLQLSFALNQDFLGDVIKDYMGPALTCFCIFART